MIYLDLFGGAGGVGRVSRELIPALATVSRQAVTVAGPSHAVTSLRAGLIDPGEAVQFLDLTPPRWSLRRLSYEFALRTDSTRGGAFACLQSELRRLSGQPSAMPFVNYPQVLHPPRETGQFAAFIYDLNWRSFPANFPAPDRADAWCRGWIEQSAITFTISEFTRQEIIDTYRIDPAKVVAAPLAPFGQPNATPDDDSLLSRHGLTPGGFHLFPGVHGAHKGHDILCAALRAAATTRPVVVTCGLQIPIPSPARARQARALREEMLALQKSGRLVVLHGLTEGEIETLRRHCHAYVLPSRYEGYGFPLAEAVAGGKPAIFSSIAAFLEIAARHGGLRHAAFPSGDSAALAALLEADAADALSWRMTPATSSEWNWDHTARIILEHLAPRPHRAAIPR